MTDRRQIASCAPRPCRSPAQPRRPSKKVADERLGHSKIAITLDLSIPEIVRVAVSSKQAQKGVRGITLTHRGG
jgi:hypothetical protein